MLTTYPKNQAPPQEWRPGSKLVADAIWLDLVDPDDAERGYAQAVLGAPIPTRSQIGSIALSHRQSASADVVRVNIPAFVRSEDGQGMLTPLGLMLTPSVLVSLRYAKSEAFDANGRGGVARNAGPVSAIDAFVGLIETMVNVAADRMEALSGELSQLSRTMFSDRVGHARMLRGALFQVGRMQRQITQTRAAMLGVQRAIKFIHDESTGVDYVGETARACKTALVDLQALAEFDQQFSDKVQFVLDAVLGFINNDQNDIMKVLTIVSVVTIPPMILAGIWGMNFKFIPEYNWAHGYAFALDHDRPEHDRAAGSGSNGRSGCRNAASYLTSTLSVLSINAATLSCNSFSDGRCAYTMWPDS